jgi:hypothetical protein
MVALPTYNIIDDSENALACTLRSKELAFVAPNARDLVVVMPKRWETVWEPLWMVAMPPFFSFPLGVWR